MAAKGENGGKWTADRFIPPVAEIIGIAEDGEEVPYAYT
jgi:hypothetical protein